tara:strand:+ start:9050 stop:9313 length:264 start_codon:yes stop_codon:yes gene_type:complete
MKVVDFPTKETEAPLASEMFKTYVDIAKEDEVINGASAEVVIIYLTEEGMNVASLSKSADNAFMLLSMAAQSVLETQLGGLYSDTVH